ncbi:MAG: GreA/GreB family elongation factor [Oligoflexia bacterium]|nr:GreA/GreB family elongation factor [Oligoflexia bacterium]
MLQKQKLVAAIVRKLEEELAVLVRAAQAARDAATHEESKPEDQHDTRGIEASYLAGAQAARAGELKQLISMYKFLPLRAFRAGDAVAAGALVELEAEGKRQFYFLVGQGGGLSVAVEGLVVQVITPRAPLGEALQGKVEGDVIELESPNGAREYEVLGVS